MNNYVQYISGSVNSAIYRSMAVFMLILFYGIAVCQELGYDAETKQFLADFNKNASWKNSGFILDSIQQLSRFVLIYDLKKRTNLDSTQRASILNQLYKQSVGIWQQKDFPNATIVSSQKLDSMDRRSAHPRSYQALSLPCFTSDKMFAVMYVYSFCGLLCGGSEYYLFEKQEGHWVYVKYIGGTAS